MHAASAYEDSSARVTKHFWTMIMDIKSTDIDASPRAPSLRRQQAANPFVFRQSLPSPSPSELAASLQSTGLTRWIEGLERPKTTRCSTTVCPGEIPAGHAWFGRRADVGQYRHHPQYPKADYGPDEPRFILRAQVMASLDYAALAA